ncbi:MAG: hypothetical protein J6M60_01400 [Clostridia bacterium]|nr:hypothetical protein [Clostridia bacterium]
MDRELLNKYNQEEKLILSKIIDKINFCAKRNTIQITDFYDLGKQNLIEKFLRIQRIDSYILYGAYENPERKVFVFYPDKFEELIKSSKISFDEYISIIRITLPNELKEQYNHQRYLGGLIKLGIKREKIGDILVDSEGADLIVQREIEKFLLTNLQELTRFQKSKIERIDLDKIKKVVEKKEIIKITVSSMRLDNIVAELAHCSRSKAEQIIEEERVFVNYENILKKTKEIKENDRITIRGKGRFEIKEVVGNTRSGRFVIEIEK